MFTYAKPSVPLCSTKVLSLFPISRALKLCSDKKQKNKDLGSRFIVLHEPLREAQKCYVYTEKCAMYITVLKSLARDTVLYNLSWINQIRKGDVQCQRILIAFTPKARPCLTKDVHLWISKLWDDWVAIVLPWLIGGPSLDWTWKGAVGLNIRLNWNNYYSMQL